MTVFGKERRLEELPTIKRSKSINLKWLLIDTPGPGTYRVQSEFGYYDPADTLGTNASFMAKRS